MMFQLPIKMLKSLITGEPLPNKCSNIDKVIASKAEVALYSHKVQVGSVCIQGNGI